MPGQTSITLDPAIGIEGMVYDAAFTDIISRVISDAAGIGAGRVVKNDTTSIGNACAALTATGDVAKCLGVTVLNLNRMPTVPRFLLGSDVGIMRRGYIFMTCVDDCRTLVGSPYIVYSGANAGLPQLSATGGDVGTGIQCLLGGNAGQLGIFAINLGQ